MWTGYEKIYVNDELVSKKFSWFGTDHFFEVKENGAWVDYVLTSGFNGFAITASLKRDGVSIIDSGSGGMHLNLAANSSKQVSYNERDFV